MSFRVDAVEIMNRFTEYSPSRGETPLPLPIPGFWFKRICALADRVEKAENQNDDLNAQIAALTAALAEANEDAAALAETYIAYSYLERQYHCIHCEAEGVSAKTMVHDENCPIALHRARCAKLEGGESVKDSPKEEAKG